MNANARDTSKEKATSAKTKKERKKEKAHTWKCWIISPQNGKNSQKMPPLSQKKEKREDKHHLLSPYFNLSDQYRRGTHPHTHKKQKPGFKRKLSENCPNILLSFFSFSSIHFFSFLFVSTPKSRQKKHSTSISSPPPKKESMRSLSVCLSVGHLSLYSFLIILCVLFIVARIDFINS
jgi:hypothetical protein